MSEEQNKGLPLTDKGEAKDSTEKKKVLSRREALLGALLGAGIAFSKSAQATEASCACLAPPDCDAVCPNGGTPRGDGTQACDCNPEPKVELAKVAYTGKYEDLVDEPTLSTVARTGQYSDLIGIPSNQLDEVIAAGSVGPTGDVTVPLASIGQIQIPYFTVNKYGQVIAKGERTFKVSTGNIYSKYSDYSDNCGDDSA